LLSLFYRLRFEQRFFFYEKRTNNFNWRVRYLLGIESKDIKGFNKKRSFFFQVMWEDFNTLGKESAYEYFINRVRIKAIFGHRISQKFRYELHYMWQRSRLYSDNGLETTQNIIRLRFFHRISKME